MADTDGVILVYNPDAPAQDQQISDWFDFFVKKNGLKDEQCMIFAHRVGNSEKFKARKSLHFVESTILTYFHSTFVSTCDCCSYRCPKRSGHQGHVRELHERGLHRQPEKVDHNIQE